MEEIINKLESIEKRLENMEIKIKQIELSNTKMDNHINFIEDIYAKLKLPLEYISNRINKMIS